MTAEARDLYQTAIHEAGHAVTAEVLTGEPASITIERHARGASVWFKGKCIHAMPSRSDHATFIALGGAVAEVMNTHERHSTGDRLLAAIQSRMSVTDQANAGNYSRADVDETIRMVLANWRAIETRARAEVSRHQAVAPGQAAPPVAPRSNQAPAASPAALPQASEICIAELASDPPVSAARAAKAAPGRDTIAMLARAWDCQPHEIDAAEDGLRVSAWARLGLPRDKLLAAAGEQHAALQARVAANDAARLRRLAAMA